MFCFKCGKKLPARVVNCPECDTPQKRRQRYRRRMFLGLFIFLAGAVCGSIFDTVFFQGKAWNHSFMGMFSSSSGINASASSIINKDVSGIESGDKSGKNVDAANIPENYEEASAPSDQIIGALDKQESETSTSSSESSNTVSESESESESEDVVASQDAPESADLSATVSQDSVEAVSDGLTTDYRLVLAGHEEIERSEGNNYHGYLSRDGKEFIFSSNREKIKGKNVYQCYRRNRDLKSPAEKLFAWPGNVWTPETTPDSKKVVFSSDSTRAEHIFVYDRENGSSVALTKGVSKNMMPSISPDGTMVVFVSNRSGANNIWLVGIDGSNLLQLTSGKEDDREPRWAENGKSIIFTRIFQQLKNSHIMKIQLEPLGEPETLVGQNRRNWLADISPDQLYLAYVRSEGDGGSRNRIVLRHLPTGEEKVLNLLGGAESFRPVWNSDGLGFVFHSVTGSSRNTYMANMKRETSG